MVIDCCNLDLTFSAMVAVTSQSASVPYIVVEAISDHLWWLCLLEFMKNLILRELFPINHLLPPVSLIFPYSYQLLGVGFFFSVQKRIKDISISSVLDSPNEPRFS